MSILRYDQKGQSIKYCGFNYFLGYHYWSIEEKIYFLSSLISNKCGFISLFTGTYQFWSIEQKFNFFDISWSCKSFCTILWEIFTLLKIWVLVLSLHWTNKIHENRNPTNHESTGLYQYSFKLRKDEIDDERIFLYFLNAVTFNHIQNSILPYKAEWKHGFVSISSRQSYTSQQIFI